MKIILLGTGTSTGVPVPGCSCKVCKSGNPKNYRDRTSAYLELNDGSKILIDSTPDLRQQALKNKIEALDAVLFTHEHADHIHGLDDIKCFCFQRQTPLPCYCTESVAIELKARFPYIFKPVVDYLGGTLPNLELRIFKAYDEIVIKQDVIQTFELNHGKINSTGYRFADISYATDCNRIPERSADIIKNSKYLFLDALRERLHPCHFNTEQAIAEAKKLNVENLILIHINHEIDHDELQEKLSENVSLGYDGLTICD